MQPQHEAKRHPRLRAPRPLQSLEPLEPRVLLSRIAGIDVSGNNASTGLSQSTWNSVHSAGYTFAWTKASEGLTFDDGSFANNMARAKNAGILIGAYHFARYDNQRGTSGADAEENHFWSDISPYVLADGHHFAPVLDLENISSTEGPADNGYTKTTLSQWAFRFLSDLKNDAAAIGITLTPLIYTGASFASTWLDSSISESFPIWMANYNGQSRDTGSPDFNGSISPWQSPNGWQFWQYTNAQSVAGISTDASVFKGNAFDLQDYIIGAAPRWPAGSRVVTNTSVTAWATSAANTSGSSVASGADGTILSAGVYGNSFWRWQVRFDNGVTGWVGEDFLNTLTPAAPTSPNPANTIVTNALPANFTWAGAANAASFDVRLDGALQSNVTADAWPHSAISNGAHTWSVTANNAELSTAGPTWSFTFDNVPPVATFGNQSPTPGSSSLTFTVTYSDATTQIDYTSLDSNDLTVTGPNGYAQPATLLSLDANANGPTRVATYSIPAPAGAWNITDNGSYTLSQNANQVKDTAGNFRPAGPFATLAVNLPFAYQSDNTLVVNFDPASSNLAVNASASTLTLTLGAATLSFPQAGVTALAITGNAQDDTVTLNTPLSLALTLDLSAGNNTLNLTAGSYTFTTTTHLAALNLNDNTTTTLAQGANIVLVTQSLTLAPTATLDLTDNDLILDYPDNAPTPYPQLQQLLQNSYNNHWSPPGLTSSAARALAIHQLPGTLTTLALSESAQYKQLNHTTTFDGIPLDDTALIIKYTYAADANLDGQVNDTDIDTLYAHYQDSRRPQNYTPFYTNRTFTEADFTYDGLVNDRDLDLLSLSYDPVAPIL